MESAVAFTALECRLWLSYVSNLADIAEEQLEECPAFDVAERIMP